MLIKGIDNIPEGKVALILGYAERLPFKDNVFDRVLIGGCPSHVSVRRRVLDEASRVLKDGGRLIIYVQITFIDRLTAMDRSRQNLRHQHLSLRIIGMFLEDTFT